MPRKPISVEVQGEGDACYVVLTYAMGTLCGVWSTCTKSRDADLVGSNAHQNTSDGVKRRAMIV
jgi:hypothetical protein